MRNDGSFPSRRDLDQDQLSVVKQVDDSVGGFTLLVTFGEEGAGSDGDYDPVVFSRDSKPVSRRKP